MLSMPSEALYLMIGVVGVLLFASGIGSVLAARAGSTPSPTVENLNARVKAWWVMVALLGAAIAFGKAAVIVLYALASFFALREFITLTDSRRGDHWALLATFFVVLPVQYYLVWIEWYGFFSIFIPVYGFLLMPVIAALRQDTENFLSRVAAQQWALMICVYCASHVPALLTLNIPGYNGKQVLLVAFLIIVVQGSDVLQYVFGKLFGKHKVAPQLSPSKTWEGLVGGVVSATALGAALWWITPFTPLQAAGHAFVICMMGFFGGLVMSAIKRDRGVKDWGHMISGHGGVLDRIDSIVFSAPIFFHLTRYWWTV
ncbi:MAG: phosphatidate cytidylyltransferase [Beijerinckiaceae bacterium]